MKSCNMWLGYYYAEEVNWLRWWLHRLFCVYCRDMEQHYVTAETDYWAIEADKNK